MRRHAFTLVEAIVATALASLIVGGMLTMFHASRRMTDVGDLSAALSDAAIAMERIHRDLSQAVQKPDPDVKSPVIPSKTEPALQFIHAVLTPEGKLEGKLVVYRRESTPGGNFRLIRRFGTEEAPLPGVYSRIGFDGFNAAGGPWVRVTLHAVAHDVKRDKPVGSEEAVLSCMVHVDSPEMLGTDYFVWDLLDGIKSVPLLKGEHGF